MAIHRVPLTRRDSFWDDPFFSDSWEDFDRLRKSIWDDHQDMFSRFEHQSKALKTSSKKSFNSSNVISSNDFIESPRHWLMPKDFFSSDLDFDLLPRLKDQTLQVTDNDKKFEISVDTHGFKPEELEVKIKNNVVTVEAKHKEKREEGSNKSFVSREFCKSYTLPKDCKMEDVKSNLSACGVLMVTAPKMQANQIGCRKVPILKK